MRLVLAVLLVGVGLTAWAQPIAPYRAETLPIPSNQAGDTALLTQRWDDLRDVVFGTDDTMNGLFAFLVDGGVVPEFGASFGAVGGIDAKPFFSGFPELTRGGVIAASAPAAGRIFLFTTSGDGGLLTDLAAARPLTTSSPRSVALADFGDAGAFVFSGSTGNGLQRFLLEPLDGGLRATPTTPIATAAPVVGIAAAPSLHRVYVSAGIQGVLAFDPRDETPAVRPLVDAGVPLDVMAGLAVYPQRDGGALLLAAVPARDLFRIYRLQDDAAFVGEFVVALEDGGRRVRGSDFIDVWPGAFGNGDAGPLFPAGVIVVVDSATSAGANYKLAPWDALASQLGPTLPVDVPPFVDAPPPPPPPPPPTRLPFVSPATTTGREPALTADVALWPPAALTLGAFTRLAVFSTDGGVTASVPAPRGGFFGVDATARPFGPFPGGVIVASSQSPDGGLLMLLVPGGDGGLVALAAPLSVAAARGVALGDFGDAGSWVFFESGSDRLHRARLHLGDGGQPAATVGAELRLPAASLGLVAAPAFGQVLVSTVAGLVAVDVVGDGGLRALDAGSGDAAVSGLAAFPLLDGGLAVLGAVPALDRFRLFAYEGGRLERLVDFEVALPDGGEPLKAGAFVDVTRAPFGQNRDGGASPDSGFPLGVVAFGEALPDGGAAVRLVPFEALAAVAGLLSGDGGTGGGPGGGAGGGPPIVEPPMGCCSGAPASASLMALAFLAWLRRFARGRSSRTLSRLEP